MACHVDCRSLAERVDALDSLRLAFRDHIRATGTSLVMDKEKVPNGQTWQFLPEYLGLWMAQPDCSATVLLSI